MQVLDAPLVTAALLDTGRRGRWAEQQLLAGGAIGTAALLHQVATMLHQAVSDRLITPEFASITQTELSQLPITLFPLTLTADRTWELLGPLGSKSSADAALAELLGCALATLDPRIAKVKGLRCKVVTPD